MGSRLRIADFGKGFFIKFRKFMESQEPSQMGRIESKNSGIPIPAGSTLEETMSSILTRDTPLKLNMEPENDGFQKEYPFPGLIFWFHVNFSGVCNPCLKPTASWTSLKIRPKRLNAPKS